MEDIADADLTSNSAESGSSLERLLDGHDRATAAAAASGVYQRTGAGRNRAQLRVTFTLPVDDESRCDGGCSSGSDSDGDIESGVPRPGGHGQVGNGSSGSVGGIGDCASMRR